MTMEVKASNASYFKYPAKDTVMSSAISHLNYW